MFIWHVWADWIVRLVAPPAPPAQPAPLHTFGQHAGYRVPRNGGRHAR